MGFMELNDLQFVDTSAMINTSATQLMETLRRDHEGQTSNLQQWNN